MASASTSRPTVSGTVTLKTSEGHDLLLNDVLHVHGMIKNLISISKLAKDQPVDVLFSEQGCTLIERTRRVTLAEACLADNLYCLCAEPICHINPVVHILRKTSQGSVDDNTLWHTRLAHVNPDKLLQLPRLDAYRHPLPKLSELPFCEPCALGKVKQTPYATNSSFRAKFLLELVHTDICGPISKPSVGGSRYFMPFVDELSKMTHTYFLKRKSEAFTIFLEYLNMAERQTGQRLKAL